MLGTWFYWRTLEKCHLAFGTLFNNIELRRYDNSNNLKQTIKVPLEYAPKEKFLARVENSPDLENPNPVQLQYPRMAFIMSDMRYDADRTLPKNNLCVGSTFNGTPNSFYSHYLPVAYNLNYELYILTKYREDAAQIVEQIIPYFKPLFNISVNLIPQINENLTFPVVFDGINISDDFEGNFTINPLIVWTLSFTVKANFYGQIVENPNGVGLIKNINLNFSLQFCKTKPTLFYVREIPQTTANFDGFYITDSNINVSTSIFTIINHGFETSDLLTYTSNGIKPYAPLIDNNDYYVIVIDKDTFRLAATKIDTLTNNPILLSPPHPVTVTITERAINQHKQKLTLLYVDELPNTSKNFNGYYLLQENVNLSTSIITINNHGFITTEVVVYNSDGLEPYFPLEDYSDYFVLVIDENNFRLCETFEDSVNLNFIILEVP